MRAVVQRVSESHVTVGDETIGCIGNGLLVLLGVARGDTETAADYLARKIAHLRIFEDDAGRMNRSLIDVDGRMLAVSQFTLLGDCRRGRRPSFVDAADPQSAEAMYRHFIAQVRSLGVTVATGRFGAAMAVSLINDGPVTLVIDSV